MLGKLYYSYQESWLLVKKTTLMVFLAEKRKVAHLHASLYMVRKKEQKSLAITLLKSFANGKRRAEQRNRWWEVVESLINTVIPVFKC